MDSADRFPISDLGSRPRAFPGLANPRCVQLCHHALLQGWVRLFCLTAAGAAVAIISPRW